MTKTHEKILAAVIEKSRMVCTDSLELVGIYGSAISGDAHRNPIWTCSSL